VLYVANVPLMIPNEGAERFLTALKRMFCVGCPAGVGAGDPAAAPPFGGELRLCLNTNAADPGCGLEYGDLALTDDTGGACVFLNGETPPNYCSASIEGPAEGLDGYWRIVFDQQIWTSNGDATTAPVITGLALVTDTPALTIIGYGSLPGGPANFENDDIVKLSAELVLRCQLPVV